MISEKILWPKLHAFVQTHLLEKVTSLVKNLSIVLFFLHSLSLDLLFNLMTKTESVEVFHHADMHMYKTATKSILCFFLLLFWFPLKLFVNVCESSNTSVLHQIYAKNRVMKSSTWSLCFNSVFYRKYICMRVTYAITGTDFQKWLYLTIEKKEKKIYFKSFRRNIINICRLGSHMQKRWRKKTLCLNCNQKREREKWTHCKTMKLQWFYHCFKSAKNINERSVAHNI